MEQQESNVPPVTVSASGSEVPVPVVPPARRAAGALAGQPCCNGLLVPMVVFDQIYSFDRDALIKAIPRPEKALPEEFAPAAAELFDRIMQMTDNAGATDGAFLTTRT